jgi:oxygen-independent coproporphyrinogen-3 oxidase
MNLAGLYVHVPFCTSVCPYCDFAVTIAGAERRASFLDALRIELDRCGGSDWSFDTVYLGGGTPSGLAVDQLAALVDGVADRLDIAPGAAWHLEINPEDVTRASARAWRRLGFSFASLGVQSLDDDALAFLGRRHTAADGRRAAEQLLSAGFDTVSADLIFGLPDQTPSSWRRQLEAVLELGVQHLSCYQLTVHDGTVFGRRRDRGELIELGDGVQAELYLLTHDVLGAAGWSGYEVSNFAAAPDHRSRHNQKYWTHAPYLGLGPSAHSYDGRRRRWWNRCKVRLWSAALARGERPVEGEETLTDAELLVERVMLGLRTAAGVDLDALRDRFGDELAAIDSAAVDRHVASGHLDRDGATIAPTPLGMAIAEGLARSLLA